MPDAAAIGDYWSDRCLVQLLSPFVCCSPHRRCESVDGLDCSGEFCSDCGDVRFPVQPGV